MADENQQTAPENTQTGTDAEAAATQEPTSTDAATGGTVTLKAEDYKNLVSSRDKSNNRIAAIEQYAAEDMQKKDISEFLKSDENAKNFPDVVSEDLLSATSPDDFKKYAEQTQARIDKSVQKRLADTEQATSPKLSSNDIAEREKQLKKSPGSSSFQEMLGMRTQ